MRRVLALALGTATFAVASSWVDRAAACSIARPPAELVGYPVDGATDVPTDVVPIYDKVKAILDTELDPGSRFVLRSADGEEVPLVASDSYYWTLELAPESELLPNTTYTLSATLPPNDGVTEVDAVVTFTTRTGRATTPTPVDGAFLEHYTVTTNPYSTCGVPLSGTCVSVPEGSFLAANFVDEFGQEQFPGYFWQAPTLANLSGVDQGTNFRCVNLRTRGPSGALSDAVSLCGAGAPLLELTGSNDYVHCGVDGVSFDAPTKPSDGDPTAASDTGGHAGACTISRAPLPANASSLVLPALLGFLFARRGGRRGQPRP